MIMRYLKRSETVNILDTNAQITLIPPNVCKICCRQIGPSSILRVTDHSRAQY